MGIYANYVKRFLDFTLSLCGLIVLSPLLLLLLIIGAVAMKGNPVFLQERPGKIGKDGKEKIFKMVKFRTMSNERDANGNLLSDEKRLNAYGRFLRITSCDELLELINVLNGDMSIVGPRPLLTRYLPYYTPQERRRHCVRPGLTGLAQVNGRSFLTWEEIFAYDLQYVESLTFFGDVKIIIGTLMKVLKRENIADVTESCIDKEGRHHCIVNGKEYILHRELDVERSGVTECNRKSGVISI